MANLTVEELKVLISAETAGLQKAVSKVQSQLQGLDKTTTKVTTKMNNAFTKLAKATGITLTIASLYRLGKAAVDAASALEEVQNVVDVAFGDAAGEIDKFAKTCIDRFGLSEFAAKQLASQFMAMGSSMGITNSSAKKMSVQLTGLAADLASFYNVSVDTAMNALEGIYTGQTRALRKFGLVVDEATLQEYALSQGITKTVRTMTAAEQATLRYNYVLQQTVNAQNDFARTSGSWANQIRLLRQQWNAFMTELGSVITAVLLPIVKWLNTILAYLTAIVRAFKAVFGIGGSSANKAEKSVKSLGGSVGAVATGLGDANKAGKELKKTLAGFDELEILNGPNDDGSGGGSTDPIGIGGGYDVGEYFDPEDWETPDLTEFQKKMEEMFGNFKDSWNKLIEALQKNTEAQGKKWDWTKILGLAGLVSVIGYLGGKYGSMLMESLRIGIADKGLFKGLIEGFKLFFASVGDLGRELVAPIINTVGKAFDFVKAALNPVTAAIAALAAGFIWCWTTSENFRKAVIDLWNSACKPFVDNLINSVQTMWNDHLKPLWDSLVEMFSAIWELIKQLGGIIFELWDKYIAPVLAWIATGLGFLLTNTLATLGTLIANIVSFVADVIKAVVDFITRVIQFITNFLANIKTMLANGWAFLLAFIINIKDVVKAIIEGLILGLIATIVGFWERLKQLLAAILQNINQALDGFMELLVGVIQFIIGVFTLDWKKAWEGIQNIFKGIFDGLVGIAKAPINLIIGLINGLLTGAENAARGVVNALNRISFSFSIPDWVPFVGGKSWSFGLNLQAPTLPRLSYLANGGVLTEPTAAMMAEYPGVKNNPEIVTPENLMRQIVMEGNDDLADTFIAVGRQIVAAIQENNVEIKIGDDVISAAAARGARDFKKRTGRSQFAI